VPEGLRAALAGHRGREVLMGVRPEHVGEAGGHAWPVKAAVEGVIDIVETIGHEVIVHARCGEDMLVAKLGAHRIPAFGESIRLEMDCGALHMFDPGTEQRLNN
jgi:multiple sugar transport system ATP-binding protein